MLKPGLRQGSPALPSRRSFIHSSLALGSLAVAGLQVTGQAMAATTVGRPERFQVALPEAALQRTRAGLMRRNWPDVPKPESWRLGSDLGFMHRLVDHWQSEYNWRRAEAAMNRFEHFRVPVDGSTLR